MSPLAMLVAVFVLAAVTPALVRLLGRNAGYVGAVVLAGLAIVVARSAGVVVGGEHLVADVAWLPSIGVTLALRLDGLGLLFSLIVLGIGALVLAYGARYFAADERAKASRCLALLTFFAGAMLGVVLADDVIALFVFWELTSVASFFLIGGTGEGKAAAVRALLTTAIGGLALFAAAILLTLVAGTSSLSAILAGGDAIVGDARAAAIIVLLLAAATTKSAQLPFHYWLPGAMVAPTPVSTYLHAATMVKAGIYLLLRFTPLFGGDVRWQVPLVAIGLATAVFGAVVASTRDDLKALLAYSTVSQLGLLVAIIGVGTPLAIAAASLHVLAHAMAKAALFMTAGVVDHAAGTRDLGRLGGLHRVLPATAMVSALAVLSMAGLPPLLGFVSKEEAFASFLGIAGAPWLGASVVALAVLSSVGTVVYGARFHLGVFTGPTRGHPHRVPASFVAPAAVVAVGGLVLGLAVGWLDPIVNTIGREATGTEPGLHLALWHGGVTAPLALSAVVVAAGSLLAWRREAVRALGDRVRLWSAERAFDRAYDGALRFGAAVGSHASSSSPAAHLLPIVGALVVAGSWVAARGALPPGAPAGWQPSDWVVVALLAGGVAGVLQARSRLAAVAALGLTGFTVAAWFVLLGAPDLALTQLLVETLTVSLIVVVFRRLPSTFRLGGRPRKVGAALIAVTAGVLATAATYLLAGRRGLSEVGARLLADGEGLTGGANIVNAILVDFRALDTLGEITVIGTAALAIVALVRMSEHDPIPRPGRAPAPFEQPEQWGGIGVIDSAILRTASLLLAPGMLIVSLWLVARGHNAVGGGFIGGLTAGAAVALLYFSRGHHRVWQSRLLRTLRLSGTGLLAAVAYGVAGMVVAGSFLAGGKLELPLGIHVGASLVFDVGVYLLVVAMVVAILRHLGQGIAEDPPDPQRGRREDDVVGEVGR